MVPEHESQEQSAAGSESPPRRDEALSSHPEAPQAMDSSDIPSPSGLPHETPVPLSLTGPESLPVRAWDVLLIAVMFVASDLLTTAATALYAFRVYHETPEQLQSNTLAIVAAQIVAYAITFAVMYFIVTRRHSQRFWSGVRWRWPARGKQALRFVAAGILLALAISYLETVLPMPSQVPFEKLFTNADAAYVMGVLAILAAPLMEELFFRGFLYPVLRRTGAAVAIVVTSVAFALVHGGQYGWAWSVVLLMFLVGLVLTTVRARTGSVASGFLIHAAYNLTLFALLYISTDRFRHLELMGR